MKELINNIKNIIKEPTPIIIKEDLPKTHPPKVLGL